MITIVKGKNINYILMLNGKRVGEVWKMKGKSGFGVKIDGYYWRGNEPNQRGGSTGVKVPRLMDAAPLALRVLMPNV